MQATDRPTLTPPKIAARYGIDVHKVLRWIKSGELRGFNIAARANGPARYLVYAADLEAFELSRMPSPPAPRATRRRASASATKDYFPG